MKILILLSFLLVTSLAQAQRFVAEFPQRPLPQLTPGKLCDRPDRYRYPENIAYCERNVSVEQKDVVYDSYRRAGFRLSPQNRSSYKIDHYVPLCMGGSNDNVNLWPQHISIFNITDSLESLACEKLAKGRISQREAVSIITRVKNDLSLAREASNYLGRK